MKFLNIVCICQYFEWIILNDSHLMFVRVWPGLCDLWWSQWMFDLCWVRGAAICRGNHDPHWDHDSPDSWLLTRDASHARPLPRPHPPHSGPVLLSWPRIPSHHDRWRETEGGDVRAPPAATWHPGPDPAPTHPPQTPQLIGTESRELDTGIGGLQCSAVQCSVVQYRVCRIGHVYFCQSGVTQHWTLQCRWWFGPTLLYSVYRTIGALFIAGIFQNAASKHITIVIV